MHLDVTADAGRAFVARGLQGPVDMLSCCVSATSQTIRATPNSRLSSPFLIGPADDLRAASERP